MVVVSPGGTRRLSAGIRTEEYQFGDSSQLRYTVSTARPPTRFRPPHRRRRKAKNFPPSLACRTGRIVRCPPAPRFPGGVVNDMQKVLSSDLWKAVRAHARKTQCRKVAMLMLPKTWLGLAKVTPLWLMLPGMQFPAGRLPPSYCEH